MEKIYNKTEDYENIIQPLINNLMVECQRLSIPMFFSAAIANNNSCTEYRSKMVSPVMLDFTLTDDLISPMLLVLNGFKPMRGDVAPEEEFEV